MEGGMGAGHTGRQTRRFNLPLHFLKQAIAAAFWHRQSWTWVSQSDRAFRLGAAAIKVQQVRHQGT